MDAEIVDWIKEETGQTILPATARSVSGGCIHQAQLVETSEGRLIFLKENSSDQLPLFEAERQSLDLLGATNTIRVPKPLCLGLKSGKALFAMEGIRLQNRLDETSQAKMGTALATLHSVSSPDGIFGCSFDNFIGATPQPNSPRPSWADFFVEQRLAHQFRLAASLGKQFRDETVLLEKIHQHLDSLDISPSLLHGDLWGGNASFDDTGEPVIFDPASYYGDGAADIAFTRVFGGFGPAFYESYRAKFSASEPIRETIYNLYHILNHFVLFGGGYAAQAEQMMTSILKEL